MANDDVANGFSPARTPGSVEPVIGYYLCNSSQTIALGDACILSGGFVSIATATAGSLLGVAAEPTPTGGSSTDSTNRTLLGVYDDPNQVFEGQVSGSYTAGTDGHGIQCDIEGTTGIMEVNENASVEDVIIILDKASTEEDGANARVRFKIIKHQNGVGFDQTA